MNTENSSLTQKAEETIKYFESILPLTQQTKWRYKETINEVKIYAYEEEDGLVVVRGERFLAAPPSEVYEYLNDLEKVKEFDKAFDSGTILEQVNDDISLRYLKYRGMALAAARDFLLLVSKKTFEDGSIIMACTSIEDEDYPPINDVVRADMTIGGYFLEKSKDSDQACRAVYIGKCNPNPKGQTPKFVINKITSTLPLILDSLSQFFIQKRIKETKKK